MDHQLTRLSKRLSFVLRHHPDKIGIKLDRYGRVDLQTLITKFNQHFGTPISEKIIRKIMRESDKQRYAIEGNTILALYGHSVPVQPLTPPTEPPEKLYHGTTHAAAKFIVDEGLKKMDRDFVHLSANQKMAVQVGKRRDPNPVIFEVAAQKAADAGILFYPTESGVWLVDAMPAKFLKIISQ
ncbi:RNA 2'-phosphotransferase [Lentilactobacillus kefiri]|nr:RNA 2'-phosphotransferase [Lentilactobacillus kefiri]MDF4143338.1 RNA 2'-phosphotransferase [Lactobacillus kefiranofaciens]MCJ2161134.1 RNA 2'-phosphotransferase [Lentilactobacillus kefiri]MCP9369550.1 RNA 2'-phosphotransferase [Lentilactobacillus kefiri]MDH5108820.1 RNA 2'-phosphotransferase [Lentilactobacillus kefiri]MDM7492830.1 RNA 2'-phosphotransferase [Lentilactobacillus kefiri]